MSQLFKLSLIPPVSTVKGAHTSQPGEMLTYRISGLPVDEEAIIEKKDEVWQIRRGFRKTLGRPSGSYATVEEALSALQNEVDEENS